MSIQGADTKYGIRDKVGICIPLAAMVCIATGLLVTGGRGVWMAAVHDRYHLRLESEGAPLGDTKVKVSHQPIVENDFPNADIRRSASWREVQTTGDGYANFEATFGASWTGSWGNRPTGAIVMVGDGTNAQGGITFWEIWIQPGLAWNSAETRRFDCGPDGRPTTCREKRQDASFRLTSLRQTKTEAVAPIPSSAGMGVDLLGLHTSGTLSIDIK